MFDERVVNILLNRQKKSHFLIKGKVGVINLSVGAFYGKNHMVLIDSTEITH